MALNRETLKPARAWVLLSCMCEIGYDTCSRAFSQVKMEQPGWRMYAQMPREHFIDGRICMTQTPLKRSIFSHVKLKSETLKLWNKSHYSVSFPTPECEQNPALHRIHLVQHPLKTSNMKIKSSPTGIIVHTWGCSEVSECNASRTTALVIWKSKLSQSFSCHSVSLLLVLMIISNQIH